VVLYCLPLTSLHAQDVIIFGGPDDVAEQMEARQWWGAERRAEQLDVPRIVLVRSNPTWRERAAEMPVEEKKDLFYRALLPLVLQANVVVNDRRRQLTELDQALQRGQAPTQAELESLVQASELLRIEPPAAGGDPVQESRRVIAEMLYKLDEVPPGLAIGQAAYESGYGTSRFAAEGNALFGQWSFSGEGMKPQQQRQQLGDHRIATFERPFHSVRAYVLNLSAHPAYEEFRKIRANLRAAGKPLDSLVLADGLLSYSERGQAYVDDLKGIIRSNRFDLADRARFREEPLALAVLAADEQEAEALRAELEDLRRSGAIESWYQQMRLD
jgi:uncharacterized FlgJ-related protein